MDKLTRITSAIVSSLVIAALSIHPAYADVNITVSGNGAGSTNTVVTSDTSSTTIDQTNNADVNNTVNTSATTGDNSASGNTGGSTSIQTGDATTQSTITNDINQNQVNAGCCPSGDTNITVSNNGNGSTNTVVTSTTNSTTLTINNTATVTNTATHTANTGNNTANNNNGNVSISTGNITGTSTITNRVNIADIKIGCCDGDNDTSITISGNGADSVNTVVFNNSNFVVITKNEQATLVNLSTWDADTGNNTADNNVGTVSIVTGNISIASTVENDVNHNDICICCCDQNGGGNPPPVVPPPPPPSTGGGSSSSSSSSSSGSGNDPGTGGSVLAAAGKVLGAAARRLPATGSKLLLSILASLMMFALGAYLRFKANRALALA